MKERLQPGYHWSLVRRFNPLWVLGIQLPGSYLHPAVDTQEKIFAKVDSLSAKILAETILKLLDLLEEGLASTAKEYGEDYMSSSLSITPTTTPAKCIMDLLQAVQNEINETRQDVGLSKLLNQLSLVELPNCKALAELLGQGDEITPLLDGFTQMAIDSLQSWQQPWMQP